MVGIGYNDLTDAQKASMWYIIATQALYELGRPLLLDKDFAVNEIVEGKRAIYSKRTDDDGWLYKVI